MAIVASQILRFGVGFYSTFVVADKVEVRLLPGITVKMSSWYQTRETQVYTKTADKEKGEKGYLWTSDGPEPSKMDTAWQSFLSRPKTNRSNKSFLNSILEHIGHLARGCILKLASGSGSFTITDCDDVPRGTKIEC